MVIELSSGVHELPSAPFAFDSSITASAVIIEGRPGAVLRADDTASRLFTLSHTGSLRVTLRDVRVTSPLLIDGGDLVLEDCTVADSRAAGGGAVLLTSGAFAARNTTFSGNSAVMGGAALLSGGVASFEDCLLTENEASERGGAMFINGTAQVTLSDKTLLQGNTALSAASAGAGGSVWLEEGSGGTLTYQLPAPLGRWVFSNGEASATVLADGGGMSSDFPFPCAPGLKGLDYEQTTQGLSSCSGLCVPGHICPGATAVPIPCGPGTCTRHESNLLPNQFASHSQCTFDSSAHRLSRRQPRCVAVPEGYAHRTEARN